LTLSERPFLSRLLEAIQVERLNQTGLLYKTEERKSENEKRRKSGCLVEL
jgi:hypothetical protein